MIARTKQCEPYPLTNAWQCNFRPAPKAKKNWMLSPTDNSSASSSKTGVGAKTRTLLPPVHEPNEASAPGNVVFGWRFEKTPALSAEPSVGSGQILAMEIPISPSNTARNTILFQDKSHYILFRMTDILSTCPFIEYSSCFAH